MGRKPLPIGSLGADPHIGVGNDGKGKPRWVKAVAQYRDFEWCHASGASQREVSDCCQAEPPSKAAEPQPGRRAWRPDCND
jgi:hypothetical protein